MKVRQLKQLVERWTSFIGRGYYKPQRREDGPVRQRIKELAATRVRYGMWRIYILLRREGFKDNHKRVHRIDKDEGLDPRKRSRRNKAATHRLERFDNNGINQCWPMDFVQDNLFDSRKFRCLTIVDNCSRYCHAIRVGKSIKGTMTSLKYWKR